MNIINNKRNRIFTSVLAAVLMFVTVFSGLGLYGPDRADAEELTTVNITFHGNGGAWEPGEGGDKKVVKVSAGTAWNNNLVPQGLTRQNHTLLGWSLSPSSKEADYTGSTIEADVELYAVWRDDTPSEEQVTVTFDPQKGVNPPAPVTIKKGTALGEKWPKHNMTRKEYVFAGWSMFPRATYPDFKKDTIVDENITVYAVWQHKPLVENKWRIVFELMGGTGGPEPDFIDVEKGKSLGDQYPDEIPTREGYIFLGWSMSPFDPKPFLLKTFIPSSPGRYYAAWKQKAFPDEEEVPVSFIDTGRQHESGWEILDAKTTKKGSALGSDFYDGKPKREGYDFIGWSTEKYATKANFTKDTPVNERMFVYAVWKIKPVQKGRARVTFDMNGAEHDHIPDYIDVKVGESLGDKYPKSCTAEGDNYQPTKIGHVFLGWASEKTAKYPDFFPHTVVKKHRTVYAVFAKFKYDEEWKSIVLFMPNGGKGEPVWADAGYEDYLASGKFPTNEPVREGYKFLGWSKNPYSEVADFTKEKNAVDIGLTIVYAAWKDENPLEKVVLKGRKSGSKVVLSWNKGNADKYYVYRLEKGNYKYIATVSKGTTYTDTKFDNSKDNYYKVRPVKVVGGKDKYGEMSNSVKIAKTTSYKSFRIRLKSDGRGVRVSYARVSGARMYRVYRAKISRGRAGKYRLVKTVKALRYYDRARVGRAYAYKVYALSGAYGTVRVSKAAYVAHLSKVTTRAKARARAVLVSWRKVGGASGYTVFKATRKNGKYSTLKSLSARNSSYKDRRVRRDRYYYYKVAPYVKIGKTKYYGIGRIVAVKAR